MVTSALGRWKVRKHVICYTLSCKRPVSSANQKPDLFPAMFLGGANFQRGGTTTLLIPDST